MPDEEIDEELRMHLAAESQRALREYLSIYDSNNDGVIDAEELGDYLRQIGMCISDEGVQFLTKSFDKNGDGKLTIDEVIENMETINSLAITDEDLIDAFKVIDKDGSGFIRLQELRKVLTHKSKKGCGDAMSPHEASVLLEELMVYDKDKDGKFSYQEFVDMFMNSAFPFKKPTHIQEHAKFKQVIDRQHDDTESQESEQTTEEEKSSAKGAKGKRRASAGNKSGRKT